MSAMSDYLEQKVLDYLFNQVSYTAPETWIALYTSDPTDADTGTEVSGGAYARVRVYPNSGSTPKWNLASADAPAYKVDNASKVTFAKATSSWGVVTHVGIRDAETGGNLLVHGALSSSKTIDTDDTFEFDIGGLISKLQ